MQNLFSEVCRIIDGHLHEHSRLCLAIDGRCGSGKTTLANLLGEHYHCTVLHTDQFYLRKEQRTPERLRTPGANLDYERFQEEVLLPLKTRSSFILRPFDHETMQPGEGSLVGPTELVIVEGSYSCNEQLREYYDLRIFLSTDPDTQLARIEEREGRKKQQQFVQQWIPMEERYFQTLDLTSIFDFVFYT